MNRLSSLETVMYVFRLSARVTNQGPQFDNPPGLFGKEQSLHSNKRTEPIVLDLGSYWWNQFHAFRVSVTFFGQGVLSTN